MGLRNGYKTGIFSGPDHRERIHNGDSSHYDVTYTTIPANAMAQIETTAGALGSLTPLNNNQTSSVFDVLLQANDTYQVTAKVAGSDPGVETVGVYIIGTPTLAVGSPDDTEVAGSKAMGGRINQVLPKAFSAHVTDGDDGNVPGVVVTFRVRGSGNAGGYLVFEDTGSDIDAGTSGSGNNGFLVSSSNRTGTCRLTLMISQ